MSRVAKYTGNIDRDIRSLFAALPVFVEITTPSTVGQELEITHSLGRVPKGFSVVKGDSGSGANSDVPIGTIIPSADGDTPTGYLDCNGSAVSRTTYADLFNAIGTTFGTGDGSTTFNLPDLRGRAPIGEGTGSGLTARTLAATGGAETHQLTVDELAAHTHTVGYTSAELNQGGNGLEPDGGNTYASGSTGGDQAHNNMQPFVVLAFYIRYASGGSSLDLTPDTDWTDRFLYAKFAVASRDLTLAIY